MDTKMNGGKILKACAVLVLVVGIALSLVTGFLSAAGGAQKDFLITMTTTTLATVVTYVILAIFIYGLGELVEILSSINENIKIVAKHVQKEEAEERKAIFEKEKNDLLEALRKSTNNNKL